MMDLRTIKEAKSARPGGGRGRQGGSHGEQLHVSHSGNWEEDRTENVPDGWIWGRSEEGRC